MTTLAEEKIYQVLLVEDDPVNIGIIVNCIGELYQLYIAKSREKAFEILEKTQVDLVLLDINLPDGNGFDICKELINDKQLYGDLHIVFMTGMDKPEEEARGIALGARDYITKPINCTVLKARVKLQIQLIRQRELLSNLARIDGTTEVNNRRAFDDHLHSEWNRGLREQQSLSLCLLDIDYFKQYNDNYGHPAGDECLRKLAKCLQAQFKRSTDFVARYGGEEFAVVLYNTDLAAADRLMNQALENFMALQIPHKFSQVSEFVSFSAGVCSILPSPLGSISELLDEADKELYRAKGSGRCQVHGKAI